MTRRRAFLLFVVVWARALVATVRRDVRAHHAAGVALLVLAILLAAGRERIDGGTLLAALAGLVGILLAAR